MGRELREDRAPDEEVGFWWYEIANRVKARYPGMSMFVLMIRTDGTFDWFCDGAVDWPPELRDAAGLFERVEKEERLKDYDEDPPPESGQDPT